MGYARLLTVVFVALCGIQVSAQESCDPGSLFEPYSQRCADINDARDQFIPPGVLTAPAKTFGVPNLDEFRNAGNENADFGELSADPPVPGTIVAGAAYVAGAHSTSTNARLHTKMFVYPDGVKPQGYLNWLFTPATNNTVKAVEVVGVYRTEQGDRGVIGVFGRPCTVDYPCPDGGTANGWQFFVDLFDLACNITHIVDDGGHAQKAIHYANHTDRLDNGAPPMWRSAVYLWNYCDDRWDLVWQHEYRMDKAGMDPAWWGPGYELFGDQMYPPILELGYEDTLLYHDGLWSELRPPGTDFIDPASRPQLTPWQLFHLDPNRSFGAGSVVNINEPPEIRDQIPVAMQEDESLELSVDLLVISDPDVDPAYHYSPTLSAFDGDNYTRDSVLISPDRDYFGTLTVPVSVNDGGADSLVFQLAVDVAAVNDAPTITGQRAISTRERTPIEITIDDVTVLDPDDDISELALVVLDGVGYQRQGNTVVPLAGVVGDIGVPVTVSDPATSSGVFELLVRVSADTVPPEITILGSSTVSLMVGDRYVDDGATANDDLDGDISDQIVAENSVNTSGAGTYSVVYSVTDMAGNSASATRTVVVRARPPPVQSSGGGAMDYYFLLWLLLAEFVSRWRSTPRAATFLTL